MHRFCDCGPVGAIVIVLNEEIGDQDGMSCQWVDFRTIASEERNSLEIVKALQPLTFRYVQIVADQYKEIRSTATSGENSPDKRNKATTYPPLRNGFIDNHAYVEITVKDLTAHDQGWP